MCSPFPSKVYPYKICKYILRDCYLVTVFFVCFISLSLHPIPLLLASTIRSDYNDLWMNECQFWFQFVVLMSLCTSKFVSHKRLVCLRWLFSFDVILLFEIGIDALYYSMFLPLWLFLCEQKKNIHKLSKE